jgi:GTP-binding protein YchF
MLASAVLRLFFGSRMKVGLVGFPQSGKSTLYRAGARGLAKGEVTAIPVPDKRFDAIVAQVKPKKVTPATVLLHDDLDAAAPSGRMFSQKFLDNGRRMDLYLHVVRAFDSAMAPYHVEVDPIRDQEAVDVEMILTDLQIVESRLERLVKQQASRQPGSPEYNEKVFCERVKPVLEEGKPLRGLEFSEADEAIVRNYQFLTVKPMVVCFNVGESEAANPPQRLIDRMGELGAAGTPAFAVCATLEEEVAQLEPEEQPEFLAALGLSEPAGNKVIQAVYESLGLITFFTAGENDTRAWPLRKGSTALKAAATIHNDIAKGFIRAEVVHFADYEAAGSLDAAYSAGKMHLEGKEYVVQDGDLLHIRNKS